MGHGVARVALLALVVLLLASSLAVVSGAQADSTPIYTLQGYVETGGASSPPDPSGVTVLLTSAGTHQNFTTQTTSSGQFSFSSSGNAPALSPGWWGLSVPPQAHVSVFGGTSLAAILPANQSVQYYYESSTNLTGQTSVTLTGVSYKLYNATINGTVTMGGKAHGGATVELLDPIYDGFTLGTNTTSTVKTNTTHVGYYSLNVPWGNWVLETIIPGSPDYYNYTSVSVDAATTASGNVTVNPALSASKSYVTWGYVSLASNHANHVPNAGNATVYDPLNGNLFTQVTPPGGFYSVGTYGAQTFDVVLSTVGYSTVWYPLTVSPSNPSGVAGVPRNVYVAPQSPPAEYNTTLSYSAGFGKLGVTTNATLLNDSVFPDLANASVGQLWAQLALDWQHNLSFDEANFPTVVQWLNSSGPFFPAGQSSATVNGTGYGQPVNYTLAASSSCASFCGLSTAGSVTLKWAQAYNLTGKVSSTLKGYTLSFQFRHPTNSQSFNYTVKLPSGFVLSAGTAPPAQTALVPDGPGGTWTSFTLVSKPSSSTFGTFDFNVVKYGSVTASVNISAQDFTWSERNVLNTSRGHYAAVAGVGENLTFSAVNSTFPSGTNGSLYQWAFGDSETNTSTTATTNHTYQSAGTFAGSLTVTSSGGNKSTVPFTVYTGSNAPTVVITVNDSLVEHAPNAIPYVLVNWSTPLQFNASGSSSVINSGTDAPMGNISVAYWNLTDTSSQDWNYTASAGANPLGNVTTTFLGQGKYVDQATADGVVIPITFLGWQYNLTLTVWDYGGHEANTSMVILVKDTQKPTPVITLKDGKGHVVSSAGVVESANHTAFVAFSMANSTDPNNGSIVWYNWTIGNSGNYSANQTIPLQSSPPGYPVPAPFGRYLQPQSKPYTVNLTVTDRAGNRAWTTTSLTVAVNTSTRPVLSVGNLTAPTTLTDGSSYTIWANVTNLFGQNSTATGVVVRFYLLPPSGTGNQINIGGGPASVTYYGYANATNGTVNSTALSTGSVASLPYDHVVRAEIHFTPSRTGTWYLWVNATASNEFAGDYTNGGNLDHVSVTLNQNPIVLDEEYGAIAVAVVIVIVGLILYFRRRVSKPAVKGGATGKSGGSASRLERGGKSGDKSKDDEDDDE